MKVEIDTDGVLFVDGLDEVLTGVPKAMDRREPEAGI
jgi:hypothetical protein